jgi:hypothetical protein
MASMGFEPVTPQVINMASMGFEPVTPQVNVLVATTTPHVCLCQYLLQ